MNESNSTTKKRSKLLIVIGLCTGILAFFLFSHVKQLNQSLAIAHEKIANDSITLMKYKLTDQALAGIITSYDSLGRFSNTNLEFSSVIDSLLFTYVNNASSLNNEIQKNRVNINSLEGKNRILENQNLSFQKKTLALEDMTKTLETRRNEVEGKAFKLESEMASQKLLLDSMSQNLVAIQEEMVRFGLDSLVVKTSTGSKIYFYGETYNGAPLGFGIGFYEGRGHYIGEWKDNLRHGKGKHFYKDGAIYEGFFENDLRHGYGVYYYNSGEIFKGHWKDDLMFGEGSIVDINGKTISGLWENGKLLQKM